MSKQLHYNALIDDDGNLEFENARRNWESECPVPLLRCNTKEIPLDTFDDGFLGPIVEEVSKSTETPIELGGFLGLASIATIAAKRFSILVEPGYFEPLNIWLAVAMEPSNRKSSVLKAFAGPLYDWERSQKRDMVSDIEAAKSARKTQEKIINDLRNRICKIEDMEEREIAAEQIQKLEAHLPQIPVVPQLLINDCTPEAVARLLQNQGERLAFLDSEADSLFAMMMGRYSDSPVLDVYLKSYSGDYIKVDRQSKESISLDEPLLTLGIAPQPGVIQDLVNKPILIKRGLLSRFLFLLPRSNVGSRDLVPRAVSKSAKSQFDAGLKYLLTMPTSKDEHGNESSYLIKMSEEANRVWKSWQREIEPMMSQDGKLSDDALKFWAGKLAGNTVRIAALLHIAATCPKHRPDEILISDSTVRKAVELARVTIDHSIAVHDLASTNPKRHRALQIFDWLRRNRTKTITLSQLHQKLRGRADFQLASNVREGCELLIEQGWLFLDFEPPRPGRPSESMLVHPKMHTKNS